MKKCLEKAQQEVAFRELLQIIGANGGKVPYSAIDKLVKTYHSNGFKSITRDNLNYRLKKNKRSGNADPLIGSALTTFSAPSKSSEVISDLSNPSDALMDISNTITTSTTEPNGEVLKKVGGRAKGSTKSAAKENEKKKRELITTCATIFNEAKIKANKAGTLVPSGTLRKIIDEESKKSGLYVSISLDTIRSRVKRGNLDAFNANLMSPIHDVEPTLCDVCIRLGKMGNPLTKTTIIELVNDLIAETEYMEKIKYCKGLRKLNSIEKLGDAWY
jgi:hypothetical protein